MSFARAGYKEVVSIVDSDDQREVIFNTARLDTLHVLFEIIMTAIYYLVTDFHILIYQFNAVSFRCHFCIYSVSNFPCYQIQDAVTIFICISGLILLVAHLLLSTRHFHCYFDQYFSHRLSNFNFDTVNLNDIFCFVFLDLLVGNLDKAFRKPEELDAIIPMVASSVPFI